MTDGWAESAEAWIARIGERGDWGREHVLDPAMLGLLEGRRFARALDVGCGEGRFCRLLENTVDSTIGIDPTARLIARARAHDPAGQYFLARAEQLPFAEDSFDLVVSYLTLIDIPDFRTGILEMARVLAPGGTLLIANLTGLVTAGAPKRWVEDENGQNLYYPARPLSGGTRLLGQLGRHPGDQSPPPAVRLHDRAPGRRPAAARLRRAEPEIGRSGAPGPLSPGALVHGHGMAAAPHHLSAPAATSGGGSSSLGCGEPGTWA